MENVCTIKNDKMPVLQTQPNHVALLFVYLIQISDLPCPILSAFRGKAWAHEKAGLNSSTNDIMIENI